MSVETLKSLKEVVQCLLNFSNAGIIRSNFIKNFYKKSLPDSNGHILFGTIQLFGAKTFRITSSKPNLLNLPSTGTIYAKAVKRCFVAKPGYIFYMVDLKALEDRVATNLSKDKNKLAILTKNLDSHCLSAYYYFPSKIEAILPKKENEELHDYIVRFEEATKTNKELKEIRQLGKHCSFALAYGCFPKKLVDIAKLPLNIAKDIFKKYHTELYSGLSYMRDNLVLPIAQKNHKIHLGLGCHIKTDEPEKEVRTLFNACNQFWSILSLLTIHKFHSLLEELNLSEDIQVVLTTYDSITLHIKDDTNLIQWVNNTIIPLFTTQYLEGQIIPNMAEAELGYNWADTVKLPNNATLEEIEEIRKKINE